ncbi:M20/M25/M40 family metallo-hydrolase [Clostridium sp. A1-XYC3]|uniref:M20/M25/M40 family metallo-hydrolase n=1 Tax=Clostridium tanneri TaxID=3037988 RepID=A0ABU4JRL5_9CLOT|nr:M20/M25/M40 family metallo-hydrolase [Clostridium sp. A1-XYC3]MDW8800779.1 M20/M25/M40 family metallo-hydrolase [Clostridium sp. A1-XYC3]
MKMKDRLMKTLLELVEVPGISGTSSENFTAQKIYGILSEIPYFIKNPQDLILNKIENDPLNRYFVSAIVRSQNSSDKTLILNGHLDVVAVDDFGHLKELAFNPTKLVDRISELGLYDEALEDLSSGDYIFGRGTADMKFGIALNIELLRTFSERSDFKGNIIFLAVPGEESNSEGMLGAIPYLTKLKDELGFNYVGALVSECCLPKVPHDKDRYVYLGSVGKVMPLFFFAGKESHVCEPFNSVSANLLASEVNRLFEYNTEFCDSSFGETAPPPLCLKQTDLKELYSVQIPLYAASYYNLLTLNMSPEQLMEKLKRICSDAFESALNSINKSKELYEKMANIKCSSLNIKPCVMTYEELLNEVKSSYGDEFNTHLDNLISNWMDEKLDNQTIAIKIIKETYDKYPNKVPMIVIGFAPPYYPDRHINGEAAAHVKFLDAVDKAINEASNKHNVVIKKDNYFMGISDLSYTGLSDANSSEINVLSSNMLSSKINYNLPLENLKKLDIPGAVIGGFGKDFHKYTERLNISYSFNVVPDIYEDIIYSLLK